VTAAHARRSSYGKNPVDEFDYGNLLTEIDKKRELDRQNKPEALQNRTQKYTVKVREPKLLGITLNRDGDNINDNYITIKDTNPNPYNIIQYSKLVSYEYGSTKIML
jgi:hypothetical protein